MLSVILETLGEVGLVLGLLGLSIIIAGAASVVSGLLPMRDKL